MGLNENELAKLEANLDRWFEIIEVRLKSMAKFGNEDVAKSIIFGSEKTGAPGQPLVTGDLRGSFHYDVEAFPVFVCTTQNPAAWSIETGIGPHGPLNPERGDIRHNPRSHVGGYHSIEATNQGIEQIFEDAMRDAIAKHPL